VFGSFVIIFVCEQVMCTDFRQEKEELIQALHKDRKMSDLPKITQVL